MLGLPAPHDHQEAPQSSTWSYQLHTSVKYDGSFIFTQLWSEVWHWPGLPAHNQSGKVLPEGTGCFSRTFTGHLSEILHYHLEHTDSLKADVIAGQHIWGL